MLAGILTRQATALYAESIRKPPFAPAAWIFPAVWTLLYALMGISAARISLTKEHRQRDMALNLFVVQLTVNFFWSLIFFNAQAFGFALLWLILLWGLIVLMTVLFWHIEPLASLLQFPYILWVSFAAYLNYGVWKLN